MSQGLRLEFLGKGNLAYLFWGGGLVSDWWLKLDNHHKRKVNQDTQGHTSRSKKKQILFLEVDSCVLPQGTNNPGMSTDPGIAHT